MFLTIITSIFQLMVAAAFGASLLLIATVLFNDDFRDSISETRVGVLGYIGICAAVAVISGIIGSAMGITSMILGGTVVAFVSKRKSIFE